MKHGLDSKFLHAAYKISTKFIDERYGKETVGGRGTGFFVQNKDGGPVLVTNRHNLDRSYKQNTSDYKHFRLSQMFVEGHLHNSATERPDVPVIMEILNFDEFRYSAIEENDIACLGNIKLAKPAEIGFVVPYEWLADEQWISKKLQVPDFVAFSGYPEWYDKNNNLPIMRVGTIASDPRFNYSYGGTVNGECLAYEAFSFGGSSGSPVFAMQQGFKLYGAIEAVGDMYREPKLIGINGGHLVDGFQHSGMSYFYKSSAIKQIIDSI